MDEKQAHRYAAIAEIADTEGCKFLKEMFEADIRFAQKLLGDPCGNGDETSKKKLPHELYMVNEHDMGFARGIKKTAEKYLDQLFRAKNRVNQN